MTKTNHAVLIFLAVFLIFPLQAGERTIPVDIILMIDKSQSMAENGKFDSLHEWVRNHLIEQVLIDGDWITLYQFYGKAANLATLTVTGAADRQKIVAAIDSIKPDGQYTDIGLALDTIKEALVKRGTNGRHKIMLLLTDMKQEAPWTSPYAGSPKTFESPYLVEARILQHDEWYEITLDMDIQDLVIKTSKELFSSINQTAGTPAEEGIQDTSNTDEVQNIAIDVTGTVTAEPSSKDSGKKAGINGKELPLTGILVVVSIIISGCAVFFLFIFIKRKKEREDDQKKKKPINI